MLNRCAQPQSIPAVPNHQVVLNPGVSLHCPTAKYILTLPNRKVSLQCSTTEYPCSAQPQSIPAVPNCRVSLQCPTTKYPCRAQPKSIPAVPKRRVSLECPTAKYQYSCSAFAVLQVRQLRGAGHFLCNNGFRVGMLEVNNLGFRVEGQGDLVSRLITGILRVAMWVLIGVINLHTKSP